MKLHRFEFQGQPFIFNQKSLRLVPGTRKGSSPLGSDWMNQERQLPDLPDCNRSKSW